MKNEEHLLFLLTRQTITDEQQLEIESLCSQQLVDWGKVFDLADSHRIAPLIARNLQILGATHLGVPEDVLKKFKFSQYSSLIFYERRRQTVGGVLDFFHQEGIRVMAVKGWALAHLIYCEPWLTISDDVDLLLSVKPSDVDVVTHRLFEDKLHGTGVEFDYFGHHDINLNGVLPIDFDRIWKDAQPLELDGHLIYVMTPEDTLLSLCINSCRKRFFRLKTLFDIAETINNTPQLKWNDFVERTRLYHCNILVYTALRVVSRTLKPSIPNSVFGALGVSPVRASLIDHTITALLKMASLSMLALPDSRGGWWGHGNGLSLILPYASYEFGQAHARIAQAWRLWRAHAQQQVRR